MGSGARREGFPVLHRHNRRRRPGQLVSRRDIHGGTPGREINAPLDIDLEPLGIHQSGQDIAPGPQFFHLQPAQNFGRQIVLRRALVGFKSGHIPSLTARAALRVPCLAAVTDPRKAALGSRRMDNLLKARI